MNRRSFGMLAGFTLIAAVQPMATRLPAALSHAFGPGPVLLAFSLLLVLVLWAAFLFVWVTSIRQRG